MNVIVTRGNGVANMANMRTRQSVWHFCHRTTVEVKGVFNIGVSRS